MDGVKFLLDAHLESNIHWLEYGDMGDCDIDSVILSLKDCGIGAYETSV